MASGGAGGTSDLEREVERLSGDLLEGRVPGPDAPAPGPAERATLDQLRLRAARSSADPVGQGLEDISADLAAVEDAQADAAAAHVASDAARVAANQRAVDAVTEAITGIASPAGSGGVTGTGLETVAAMTTGAAAALTEPPARGAPFGARHARNLAIAGTAIVALAAFVGAILVLQGNGAGGSDPSTVPGSIAQASGPGSSAGGPIALPSLTPSPTTSTSPSTASPSPSAEAATPSPGSSAAATAAAAGSSRTFRGSIAVRAIEKAGLEIGEHSVELVVFEDTGKVTGTFVLEIPRFPIGALLTRLFGGEDDPDYAAFRHCTVRLVMAGDASGTYRAATGALKGKVVFRPTTDDVRGCLDTRPSNVTIDAVTKSSTIRWTGTVQGTTAKGKLAMDPVVGWSAKEE